MTDPRRPMTSAETELRRSISAVDTDIPVISLSAFRPDADKQVGDEFVRCTGFVTDAFGWPVMTGCQRGVAQEDGGSEPRGWPGGSPVYEVGWTSVDILDSLPTAKVDDEGRRVHARGAGGSRRDYVGTIDPQGMPYWKDTTGDVAIDFDYEGHFGTSGSGNGQFTFPAGITASASALWVADRANGRVQKFTHDGVWVATYGPSATLADFPAFMGYDSLNDRVGIGGKDDGTQQGFQVWPSTFAARTFQSGTNGTGNGQFTNAWGVAADSAGNWFVVDFTVNRVQKFNNLGVYQSQWGAEGSGNGQFGEPGPYGICIDVDGNIHVADDANRRIQKFDSAGTFLLSYATAGQGPGQVGRAFGIAANDLGYILVTDPINNYIHVFTTGGEFISRFTPGQSGLSGFGSVYGIATYGDRVWVTDDNNDRVHMWRASAGEVPPGITPIITERTNSFSLAGSTTGQVTVTCLAGEVVTGGGCDTGGDSANRNIQFCGPDGNGWRTRVKNDSTTATIVAHAMCLQTPLVEG